ncbi:MAG: DUF4331 domain-containing protein, partial [Actinobacteria bacterium]|nr:DUF4331 domain-containing protein [Actinomycetota bacterium]
YRFDDRARYYINIDNTGDGNYDVRYRFDFRTKFNNRNFLHSLTPVTSLDDPQLFQSSRSGGCRPVLKDSSFLQGSVQSCDATSLIWCTPAGARRSGR